MSSAPKPFLPYGRQTISEADIAAKEEVLSSPFLTQGPTVPTFAKAVAAKVGARHGVAVNSATSDCPSPAWPWGWSWGLEVGSGLSRSRLWPRPTAAAIAALLWILWTSTPPPLR
jgi:hypothetical protein